MTSCYTTHRHARPHERHVLCIEVALHLVSLRIEFRPKDRHIGGLKPLRERASAKKIVGSAEIRLINDPSFDGTVSTRPNNPQNGTQ